MDNNTPNTPPVNMPTPPGDVPGKGAAIGSLVCGIIAVVFWFFGVSAIVSVILGIVGLVLASNSKKAGFNGGLRTAGFILSLLGLIFGGIIFVSCIACAGMFAAAGNAALNDPSLAQYFNY